jgi:uncharacterized zinc-type alcohol dehydrogenase-like protein
MVSTAKAFAASDKSSPLGPVTIERRDVGPRDVQFDILFCGVCHSDLHTARGQWKGTTYPCVPGHEIVGRVVSVGREVKRFKPGDIGAVGCLVDSCRSCVNCKDDYEQFCVSGATWTYNSADKKLRGHPTYGGYSNRIVVDEHFCLHVPLGLDLAATAPLLCAGITTYSPLKHWGAGKGKKVGIVGLGGLGHMAVKFAHSFGAHTVVFTTSPAKKQDAERFGADEFVISTDSDAMRGHETSFDFILDTVSVSHDLDAYTALLKRDSTLALVGGPEHPHPSPTIGKLISRRRSIAGSLIGGIKETQEMLGYCAAHGITCDIEIIKMQQINDAYERMLRSDVKYRFVIDMSSV